MAFSARSLVAKTCLVVLRPFLYAVSQGWILVLIRSLTRFLRKIINNFRCIDNRVNDRKISTSPCGFPCFWMTVITSWTISLGHFPVLTIFLKDTTTYFLLYLLLIWGVLPWYNLFHHFYYFWVNNSGYFFFWRLCAHWCWL